MDGLLKFISEALNHCFEGVVHLFFCFVANEDFAPSLGRCIDGNVIGIFDWVMRVLEGLIEVLCIQHFRHHDA